ncbi:hypothetical protein V3N99_21200 [Dermatophilaceae bacterium Soc4.6]
MLLLGWARQSVLLLNTTLTVGRGESASHAGHGWETFTDAVISVISVISARQDRVVFVLWSEAGRPADDAVDSPEDVVLWLADDGEDRGGP